MALVFNSKNFVKEIITDFQALLAFMDKKFGKKYTYGLMGRKGFEEDAAEAKEWFQKISGISLKI